MQGGGTGLTAIRSALETAFGDAYIPSSSSSREGFKKDEDAHSHYKNTAHIIAEKADTRDIILGAHSLGVLESVSVMQELLHDDSWKGKKINLRLISPIGFGEHGLTNIWETYQNSRALSNFGFFEQHMAYPLPESYYEANPSVEMPEDMPAIFKDSPQARAVRRDAFAGALTTLIPSEDERTAFENSLKTLDQSVMDAIAGNMSCDDLLQARSNFLTPYIQKLFEGKHLPAELHEKYRREYGELEDYLMPVKEQWLNMIRFGAEAGGYFYKGLDNVLSQVLQKAKSKGKEITFGFVMQEKDVMVPLASVDAIREGVNVHDLADAFEGFQILEQHAHSSLGYHPDALVSVLR